jgi:hypothetical protein
LFNKKSVFVLGAGASAECGMPIGNTLKEQIGEGVRFKEGGDYNFTRLVQRWLENTTFHPLSYPVSFPDTARELADTVSTFPSIDEALHWWRQRKEIVELGKLAIAFFILQAERASSLQFNLQSGRVQIDNVALTWFYQFLSIALSGLDIGHAQRAFEHVTLINFNYDRTVEHYLFHALQQRARVPAEKAKEAIAKLQIIRPYGCIGPLDWQQERGGIAFGGIRPASTAG